MKISDGQLKKRWDERVVRNNWDKVAGEEGGYYYLEKYGKNISDEKRMQLADYADKQNCHGFADGMRLKSLNAFIDKLLIDNHLDNPKGILDFIESNTNRMPAASVISGELLVRSAKTWLENFLFRHLRIHGWMNYNLMTTICRRFAMDLLIKKVQPSLKLIERLQNI